MTRQSATKRLYILDNTGRVLGGPYLDREKAEVVAEKDYRSKGTYAAVDTLDNWRRPFRDPRRKRA